MPGTEQGLTQVKTIGKCLGEHPTSQSGLSVLSPATISQSYGSRARTLFQYESMRER